MKELIIFPLFIILLAAGNCASSQTATTIYTPKGSPTTAYHSIPEMDSTDMFDWSDYVSTTFPNATEINPPSASATYNCHGYAWHVSEGGFNKWIGLSGYDSNPYIMEDIYWEDGSYVEIASESDATKISYYNGNHSAIQTSTQGVYISKWGQRPLMRHSSVIII